MTPSARKILPTDLVALVSYDGRVYSNEAMTRDRIGTNDSPHPLETAFEQWFSFATGRHTAISVKGTTLRGLVSARKRGSKLAWEIDCLIHAPDGDNGVLMSLLDQLTRAAGKSGALRIFVRLPGASETAHVAMHCGFAQYQSEIVHARAVDAAEAHVLPEGFRQRAKGDQYALFQLYNAVVPQTVRTAEAMTFAEWTAAQERLGKTSQYVVEHGGAVRGWLRVARDGDIARFDVLAEPGVIDDLLEAAMAKVASRRTVYTVVPEHDTGLRAHLESLGFAPGDEYSVLVRRTARTVKAPRSVPVLVHTAG
jgi:hypothetical protein